MRKNKEKRRLKILKRDGYRCGIHSGGCGKKLTFDTYTEDHIIPKNILSIMKQKEYSKFHQDINNIQPMCKECNERKGGNLVFSESICSKGNCHKMYFSNENICFLQNIKNKTIVLKIKLEKQSLKVPLENKAYMKTTFFILAGTTKNKLRQGYFKNEMGGGYNARAVYIRQILHSLYTEKIETSLKDIKKLSIVCNEEGKDYIEELEDIKKTIDERKFNDAIELVKDLSGMSYFSLEALSVNFPQRKPTQEEEKTYNESILKEKLYFEKEEMEDFHYNREKSNFKDKYFIEKANKIIKNTEGNDANNVLYAYNVKVLILIKNKDLVKAKEYCNFVLNYFSKRFHCNSDSLFTFYMNKIICMILLDQDKNSIQLILEQLKSNCVNLDNRITILASLGDFYLFKNDLNKGFSFYSEAYALIKNNNLSFNHKELNIITLKNSIDIWNRKEKGRTITAVTKIGRYLFFNHPRHNNLYQKNKKL